MLNMSSETMYIGFEPGLLPTMLCPLACCWAQRMDSVSMPRERYKNLENPYAEKIPEIYYTLTCSSFSV